MSLFVLQHVVIQSEVGAVYFPGSHAVASAETLAGGLLYASLGALPLIGNLSGHKIRCLETASRDCQLCESKEHLVRNVAFELSALLFPQKKEIQPLQVSLLTGGRP